MRVVVLNAQPKQTTDLVFEETEIERAKSKLRELAQHYDLPIPCVGQAPGKGRERSMKPEGFGPDPRWERVELLVPPTPEKV